MTITAESLAVGVTEKQGPRGEAEGNSADTRRAEQKGYAYIAPNFYRI